MWKWRLVAECLGKKHPLSNRKSDASGNANLIVVTTEYELTFAERGEGYPGDNMRTAINAQVGRL